jgi:hypothetical protein
MIGKSAQSSFGIVLVTPDDMGYLKTEKPEDAKPRARPERNHGNGDAARVADQKTMRNFAKGICGTPLEYGRGDHPSFNDHVRETVPKLVQRLQDAGFKLDPGAIGRAQG